MILLKYRYKTILIIILVFCFSCGDIFSNKKNIFGKYYLIESDVKWNFSICYKTRDGDYIGRVPQKIVEYAVIADSLIVAKSIQKEKSILFYIVKIKQDSDYASEVDFLIGPITEMKFNDEYKKKMNIKFKRVPSHQ